MHRLKLNGWPTSHDNRLLPYPMKSASTCRRRWCHSLGTFLLLTLGAATVSHAADSAWYPFTPSNDLSKPSLIGLQDWIEGPAGAHGRVTRDGDRLMEHGRPLKLWGTNICYANSAPGKDKAVAITAWYVKMGLNALRHHKHLDGPGWQGMQSADSVVVFDPAKLDRFDYFNSLLKQAGITFLHSPTFGTKFGPADKDRIPYWQELGAFDDKRTRIELSPNATALSREISDLQIEQTVNFLTHTNPYTGLRYADEPQLFAVELVNEGTPLFGVNTVLQQSPTLRQRAAAGFSAWLLKKYSTDEAWRQAWGTRAIVSDPADIGFDHLRNLISPDKITGAFLAESPTTGTVVPWANPWFNDHALVTSGPIAPLRRRLLDTIAFLDELQTDFYVRFEKAIRDTGYTGEIIRSNWQAGSLAGHLLNLHTDAQTGIVDRHNYHRGGGFTGLAAGKPFNKFSTLTRAGGGNYTAGFQQVEGATFSMSEWTHEQPNEYYAEGPVSFGAYGFGLQGWDASFHFLFNERTTGFSRALGENTWDASNPAIAATFPAVSRMVRRGDVKESPTTFHLNAHLPSIKDGNFSFLGVTEQTNDQKIFASDKAPVEALAAQRIAIRYTATDTDTPTFDLQPFLAPDGRTVVSSTGELRWTPAATPGANGGHITIATKGTKAFVGFASGDEIYDLGDGFAIQPAKGFAVIILTARAPDKNLLTDNQVLVTAVARARNTGMQLNLAEDTVLAKGATPILMEPVRATVHTPYNATLKVLDQDGIAATSERPANGSFTIDGSTDRSPFYLIQR